jgi:hypothetical protein
MKIKRPARVMPTPIVASTPLYGADFNENQAAIG